MFCGFRSNKFSGKCKRAVKYIKMRIEPARRKKQAVVRILKKDVADLIAAGYETNAYRRIDAMIIEINLVFCYDLIEKFSEHVKAQLRILQKHSECPEEVMEEISTLIYAAARFSDLPELCVLRHLFVEKYGSSMESSVCSEFAENLKNKTFCKEKKLQLMESITQEYCVSWDAEKFDEAQCNQVAPPYARNRDCSLMEEGIDKGIHVSNLPSAGQKHQVESEHRIKNAIPSYDKLDGNPAGMIKYDLPFRSRMESKMNSSTEVNGVVSLRPLDPKPAYVTPYTKSNATGYHVGKTRREIRYDNHVEEHEEELDSVELRKQPARSLDENVRADNLISHYSKPRIKDTPIHNNVAEETDRQNIGVDQHEKPKTVSVRRKYQVPMFAETGGTAINNERCRSHIPGSRDDKEKATVGDWIEMKRMAMPPITKNPRLKFPEERKDMEVGSMRKKKRSWTRS